MAIRNAAEGVRGLVRLNNNLSAFETLTARPGSGGIALNLETLCHGKDFDNEALLKIQWVMQKSDDQVVRVLMSPLLSGKCSARLHIQAP